MSEAKTCHQCGQRIDLLHPFARLLLVNEPIEQVIHDGEVFRANVGVVFAQVLEVRLLHHRRFVDMERE